MSTRKSKARRAIAHNARLALIKDNPFMCKETRAANNQRIESMAIASGSTVADTGLNQYRDSMQGLVSGNAARRIKSRYGSMLPLARIATGSHHDKRTVQAISMVNLQVKALSDLKGIPLSEAIDSTLSVPVSCWTMAVWHYAYHSNRYQWLKSDSARTSAKRGILKAIADIKRLNSNDVDILTALAKAWNIAK